MNWIILLIILLIGSYLWSRKSNQKARDTQNLRFASQWGKPKKEPVDIAKIKRYKDQIPQLDSSIQYLSDQENKDLDLDAVFAFIDRTTTPIGQQYLYYKLHTIEPRQSFQTALTLEEELGSNPETRQQLASILQELQTKGASFFHYLFTDSIQPNKKQHYLSHILNSINAIALLLLGFYPLLSLLFILTIPLSFVMHYRNKYQLYAYQNGITQLRKVKKACHKLATFPPSHSLATKTSYAAQLKKMTRLTLWFDNPNYAHELITLVWFPVELIKIIFNIETLVFYHFLLQLETNKQALHEAFQVIGEVDIALSNASCKVNHATCTPLFTQTKQIRAEAIYHPLLDSAVSNTLVLHQESLLLTGSNMSGKTTFIRTLAINAVLSQTLGFAFATAFHLPFCRIHTSIRITDDLLNQTSYYLKEVETIHHFIEERNQPHFNLFVLDEILKGTNTTERIAASCAILDYLNAPQSIVLVATHDMELIQLLKEASYAPYYFSESFDQRQQLHFDYTLKPGIPTTTNAIKILQYYQYPEDLIKRALQVQQILTS